MSSASTVSFDSVSNLIARLREAGVTQEHLRSAVKKSDMNLLATVFESARNECSRGVVYDSMVVQSELGLKLPEKVPVAPVAVPGTITVYHGGWSQDELKKSPHGSLFPGSYNHEQLVEPGYYSLQILPASAGGTWLQQKALPMFGSVASASVLALARLMHERAGCIDVFHERQFRCSDGGERSNTVLFMHDDPEHQMHLLRDEEYTSSASDKNLVVASMFRHPS